MYYDRELTCADCEHFECCAVARDEESPACELFERRDY